MAPTGPVAISTMPTNSLSPHHRRPAGGLLRAAAVRVKLNLLDHSGAINLRLNCSGGSGVFIVEGSACTGGRTCKAGQDMSSQPRATGSLRWVGVSHRTLMVWRLLSVIMLLVMGGIHLYLVFDGVGGLPGKLFVLNAVGALVLAIAIIVLRGRLLLLATVLSLLFMVHAACAGARADRGAVWHSRGIELQAGAHHAGGGVHRHDHPGGNRRAGVAVATSTLTAHLPATSHLVPMALIIGSADHLRRIHGHKQRALICRGQRGQFTDQTHGM